jgi:hypothetical protein
MSIAVISVALGGQKADKPTEISFYVKLPDSGPGPSAYLL